MKLSIYLIILLSFLFGCQQPPVSIQPPAEKDSPKDSKQKKELLDEYLNQVNQEQNPDEDPRQENPQEYLESLTRESRQELEREKERSNIVPLIDNPLHSRFNSSTYAKSLGSRFLSLQEETSKSPEFMTYQSINDHILTQLLQGISFSAKAITPNEAIETYQQFYMLNLFPNYDQPKWPIWNAFDANEPLKNIEFFESAAVLTKASLLSGFKPLDIYKKYFLPIMDAYNSHFELDNHFSIKDYLSMAYLTEQYVFYSLSTDITSETANDFIILVDNYNCQLKKDNSFIDKISCFKSQNYIDSSLSLATSLHSPDVQKVNSFKAFDLKSNDVNDILSQLDQKQVWNAQLTSRSKLKLAGMLVWSNIYNEDKGQSVIENFNSIYKDLMHSKVIGANLRMTSKESKKNIKFELKYDLNEKNYSKTMFNPEVQEEVQAIAIELTRASIGLY